jgi:hypothetical protein
VILSVDGQAYCRFAGESDDGKIDGRSTRWVGSLENYKAWVDYWRHAVDSDGWEKAITSHNSTDNYYVERSGERVVGTIADANLFVDDLFEKLIGMREKAEETVSAEDRVASLFERLDIKSRVESDFVIPEKHLRFDYRFDNGASHLMKRVPITPSREPWEKTQLALYAFEHVPTTLGGRTTNPVALVSGSNDQKEDVVKLLKEKSRVIYVDDEDRAVDELRTMFGLRH